MSGAVVAFVCRSGGVGSSCQLYCGVTTARHGTMELGGAVWQQCGVLSKSACPSSDTTIFHYIIFYFVVSRTGCVGVELVARAWGPWLNPSRRVPPRKRIACSRIFCSVAVADIFSHSYLLNTPKYKYIPFNSCCQECSCVSHPIRHSDNKTPDFPTHGKHTPR